MTQTTVQEILQRAINDDLFRKTFLTKRDSALAQYKSLLTEAEYASLKVVDASLIASLRQVVAAQPTSRWYLPRSFKEMGAAVLSLVLLVLMLWTAQQAFAAIGVPPQVVDVGDSKVLIESPFNQAKDLLSIFFPLFSAVGTFYLGVTIEGKRADRNAAEADQANAERKAATDEKDAAVEEAVSAEKAALKTRHNAQTHLANVERVTLEELGAGRQGSLEGGVQNSPMTEASRESAARILQAVRKAREALDP